MSLALKSPHRGCKNSETPRAGDPCRLATREGEGASLFCPRGTHFPLRGGRDLGLRPLSPPSLTGWRRALCSTTAALVLGVMRRNQRRTLLAHSCQCDRVLSLGGLAVSRLSRRRYLRRRVRCPCAHVIMPPYSRRRHARPPPLRGGGSLSWHQATYSAARALCALRTASGVIASSRGGARRHAALTALLPAAPRSWSLRRHRHAAALTAVSCSAAAAPQRRLSLLAWSNVIGGAHVRTRPLLGRSPLRGNSRQTPRVAILAPYDARGR